MEVAALNPYSLRQGLTFLKRGALAWRLSDAGDSPRRQAFHPILTNEPETSNLRGKAPPSGTQSIDPQIEHALEGTVS